MYPHNIIIAMAKQKQVVSKIHRSPQSPILIIRLILICADRALDTEYDWILILLKAHHYDNVATTDKRHETIGQQVWSRGSAMDRDCKDQGLENSGISLVAARCTPAAPSHGSIPPSLSLDTWLLTPPPSKSALKCIPCSHCAMEWWKHWVSLCSLRARGTSLLKHKCFQNLPCCF